MHCSLSLSVWLVRRPTRRRLLHSWGAAGWGEALDAGLQALLTALALRDLLAAPTPG